MAKENNPAVVYDTRTNKIVHLAPYKDASFKSMGAAKACKTRLVKDGKYTADQIEVADKVIFNTLIYVNPMVERTNLQSGKKYMEREDTAACCSPSSELYWSM